jgi:hypothetical protein
MEISSLRTVNQVYHKTALERVYEQAASAFLHCLALFACQPSKPLLFFDAFEYTPFVRPYLHMY